MPNTYSKIVMTVPHPLSRICITSYGAWQPQPKKIVQATNTQAGDWEAGPSTLGARTAASPSVAFQLASALASESMSVLSESAYVLPVEAAEEVRSLCSASAALYGQGAV